MLFVLASLAHAQSVTWVESANIMSPPIGYLDPAFTSLSGNQVYIWSSFLGPPAPGTYSHYLGTFYGSQSLMDSMDKMWIDEDTHPGHPGMRAILDSKVCYNFPCTLFGRDLTLTIKVQDLDWTGDWETALACAPLNTGVPIFPAAGNPPFNCLSPWVETVITAQ